MRHQLAEDMNIKSHTPSPTRTQIEYLGRIGRFQLLEDCLYGHERPRDREF